MKYERNEIVSSLYEMSKSQKGGYLLSASASCYEVYALDKVKDEFCKRYRHDEKLRSCDVYYFDQNNQMAVEFKNTHHRNLKEYYNEIESKMIDTHMLLSETFCRNKNNKDLSKKLSLLLVYNDALNYGKGICQISNALNTMRPKSGDASRNVIKPKIFENDEEFFMAIEGTKSKYEGQFYKEIQFIEKTDFEADYIKTGYFDDLADWSEME